jgi:hypothetical protein
MTQGILNLGAKYKLHISRSGYFTPTPPSTVELWGPKDDTADVEKKKISCHYRKSNPDPQATR